MRVPFERSAKCMKYTNETGNKVFAFIHRVEHTENDTTHCLKKTIQQGTILQKEVPELFIDGKNTVAVSASYEFKGHLGGTLNTILIATGGAKLGMTAKGNKFKLITKRASVHGTAEGGIPTVNHFFNIFNDNVTRMKKIEHFFIMVDKNLLQNIHKTIIKKKSQKGNPYFPS